MVPTGLGPLIGVGKEAEVFDAAPDVLKLYRAEAGKLPAFREAAILAILEPLDVPSPSVVAVQRHGNRWGITMSKADGLSFAEQMREAPDLTVHLQAMARLHAQIHRLAGTHLPSQRERLRARIEATPLLSDPTRKRLLDGLGELATGDRLCHGDFHPFNIIGQPGVAIIVDWLDACQGVPAADLCRSYLLMSSFSPEFARRYIDICSDLAGIAADEIYRWLPFLAAARLMENVPEETERLLAMAQEI